ncbi:pyruvate kinase [Haloarcula nitratireducens]|uniref:Pyruvate kinase n=1 Tax=Haloarcula nitratireducens TaxID=2487749 RepID=A0AAW4P881_9EURY|nr:pyruvate kinase [Halomicroarcula nitratireducens]MBX0294099.1 pyruvate kinase [Halomicroarcula nitratireducens]
MRNAKIVCTLGPASESVDKIAALAEAGMSVARLNASHGSPEHRREMIDRIREVDDAVDSPVAAMLDMPGPEVRTAPVREPIELVEGTTVRFVVGDEATPEEIGLSQSITNAEPGDRVLLDDGRIETTVERIEDEVVFAHVENGGELGARKGVNVPGVELDLPTITENDERELDVAAEKEPDFVAASFVRDGEDIYEISQAMEERGIDIPIIAKIERSGAVENLDSIIEAAYGVMVARGDLGVECPLEDVPIIQKRIIRKCHQAGVPVITATEMLDSMVHSRRPTRAEASDVANAVLDGTDAVMLSGETAIGDHPARVVETMDRIVRDVEESDEYAESREQRVPTAGDTRTDALARSARFLARDIGASAVVAASESGYTALKAAKYRPSIPIVASTPNERVRRKLALSWGITPVTTKYTNEGADAIIQTSVQAALDTRAAEGGDTVVVLSGMMTELDGMNTANMLKVHVAAETLVSGRSVVSGLVTGPVYHVEDGDLTDAPDGAILSIPEGFDGEFTGDTSRVGGVVDAHEGITSYAAIVARELSIPMVSDARLPDDVEDGAVITLDAERGVVYEEAVGRERLDDVR